jgi:hypothetical protein
MSTGSGLRRCRLTETVMLVGWLGGIGKYGVPRFLSVAQPTETTQYRLT